LREVKLAELVLDMTLYPRTKLDASHIRYMGLALQGGAVFPPVVVDKKSLRVIDGFHRISMYRRINPNQSIEVVEKNYKNDAAMFEDAVRMNAHHGRNLSPFDRTHCILRAETFGLSADQIANALSITVEAVGELRADRVGELKVDHKTISIPLKRTIRHMAGQKLTQRQNEANSHLGGMNQLFYINQVAELIEAKLIDTENEHVMAGLNRLNELLEEFCKQYA
jgi:hypothetical protein